MIPARPPGSAGGSPAQKAPIHSVARKMPAHRIGNLAGGLNAYHNRRFTAVRPNHLWHVDFVHRFIDRASIFTLILIDDSSRFAVGHGVSNAERAGLVLEVFEEAVTRHGTPEMVVRDKGSAFWSWRGISRFTSLLAELGVDPIVAKKKERGGAASEGSGLPLQVRRRNQYFDRGACPWFF